MRYEDSVINEVASRNDIVDVIGSYVKLQKKGANHMGLCPFHGEKTASFCVSAQKQTYHCFGCGVGGNVFTFVMEYENYSFLEAVRFLADRGGVALPEIQYTDEAKRANERKAQLFDVNKSAAKYFYVLLKKETGKAGYEYLKKRGLSDETIHHFGLGYSDKFRDDLYRYLKSEGYEDELLKESGLVTIDERGGSDKFWNRVMYPIMDVNSKVIAFGGRVMGEGEPKYLNSPETKLFDKSRTLYGLNFARTSRKPYLLLCEGYMDVIALHQAGFTNAVASLGTAFTGLHANIILRYVKECILTFDSDGAGVKAALRAIPILKEAGISVKVLDMQPYKDPDEFIKALSAEEYQKRIDEALPSFFYEIKMMERGYDLNDPEQKTKFYHEIALRLVAFPEEIERNNYMEAVNRIYNMGFDNLRRLVNRMGSKHVSDTVAQETIKREREQDKTRKKAEDGVIQLQKMLLTWMAEEPMIISKVRTLLTEDDFCGEPYRDVAKQVFTQYQCNQKISPDVISRQYESIEEQAAIADIFSFPVRENMTKAERNRAFSDSIIQIKRRSLEQSGKRAIENNDIKEYQRIIKETADLQKLHISLEEG